jgi:hypothetical protein
MWIREAFIANTPVPYEVRGNYFRVAALSGVQRGTIAVDFFRRGEKLRLDVAGIDSGQGVRDAGGFDRFIVTSTETQIVDMQVLLGEAVDNRVTGDVSVIDGELARSLNDLSFVGSGGTGPILAQFSHQQLWNPAGTGRDLVIDTLWLSRGAAGGIFFRWNQAALAVAGTTPRSKRLNAAAVATVALSNSENNAAAFGTAFNLLYVTAANDAREYRPRKPIIVEPGYGFIVAPDVVNVSVQVGYDYWERVR